MDKQKERLFKYCVVGNIVKERIDEDCSIKHGTIEFSGGTKVYLCGKPEYKNQNMIEVIGLSRMKRYSKRQYRVAYMPKMYIDNVRASKVYKTESLEIMNNDEFYDEWWHDSLEDKRETEEFVEQWNNNYKEVNNNDKI